MTCGHNHKEREPTSSLLSMKLYRISIIKEDSSQLRSVYVTAII